MKRKPQASEAQMAKAKKTMSIRRTLPHMSGSACTSLVKYAKTHDISDVSSSGKQLREHKMLSLEDTPYGPLLLTLPLYSKPPYANRELVVVNPMSYLYSAYRSGGGFCRMLNETLRDNPSSLESPWRLALYSYEVVPGNQLQTLNARKVWVIYFSFLEFNLHLRNEVSWCPLVAEPPHDLKTTQSGISQVFAAVFELCFGSHVFDVRNGIQQDSADGTSSSHMCDLFNGSSGWWCSQGCLGCKGDAGTRFGMLCLNLVKRSSGVVDTDGSRLLVSNLIHEHQMRFASDADIIGAMERLARFKVTDSAGDFKLREQAIGFTYSERGLLTDAELKAIEVVHPASQFCYDWMHGIFGGGIFNVIFFHLC